MKALTIKQPWATLIMQGDKRFEFRSWQTKYRGDLLIHAGKGIDKEAMKRLEKYLPNHLFVFSIIIGLVTCALTIILSSIIVFLFNIAPLTVMQMMIFKGITCAVCGGIAGYLCIIKVAYRK